MSRILLGVRWFGGLSQLNDEWEASGQAILPPLFLEVHPGLNPGYYTIRWESVRNSTTTAVLGYAASLSSVVGG